jgi:hypothetical protein
MHPKIPGRECIDGSRRGYKECEDCARKEDTTPEPELPLVLIGIKTGIRTAQDSGHSDLGSFLRLYSFDDHVPTTEVQDFSDQACKKDSGWNRPPTCISPDTHHNTSAYQ